MLMMHQNALHLLNEDQAMSSTGLGIHQKRASIVTGFARQTRLPRGLETNEVERETDTYRQNG